MPEDASVIAQLVQRVSVLEARGARQQSFDSPMGNGLLIGEFSASFPSTVVGTAATYANVHGSGTTLATVVKHMDDTHLLIEWIIAASASGSPMDVRYAARVGGVDHGGWSYRYAANSDRRQVVGWARATGILAGSQSVELRYRIESGTSVNWNSGNDSWGYKVWEIPALGVA